MLVSKAALRLPAANLAQAVPVPGKAATPFIFVAPARFMKIAAFTRFQGGSGFEEGELPFPNLPPVKEDDETPKPFSNPPKEPENPLPDDLPENHPKEASNMQNNELWTVKIPPKR